MMTSLLLCTRRAAVSSAASASSLSTSSASATEATSRGMMNTLVKGQRQATELVGLKRSVYTTSRTWRGNGCRSSSSAARNFSAVTSVHVTASPAAASQAAAGSQSSAGSKAGGANGRPARTVWEYLMGGAFALAASTTAVVVASYPPPTTSQEIVAAPQVDMLLGGGGGGGSGGGGGPTVPSSPTGFKIPFEKAVEESSEADEKVAGRPRTYDVSVRALKGIRVTMEDEYFVGDSGRFAAVFDGHGGNGVSKLLRNRLYDWVCHYLALKQWEERDDDVSIGRFSIFERSVDKRHANPEGEVHDASESDKPGQLASSSSPSSPGVAPSLSSRIAALRSAFGQIEQDALEDDDLEYQGSTAVAVVLHESEDGQNRTILSANVGDSRAILSREGMAVELTRDHKPNEEREKARILGMGETIEWDSFSKVHRVRNLSLSRAIGDRYAKPVVSGQVEIKLYPVDDEKDEFVLLASDGLWDVMTSQDVVSFVHRSLNDELSNPQLQKEDRENVKVVVRRNMARFVAREAIRRGSGDNVCVLMVWLNDLKSAGP